MPFGICKLCLKDNDLVLSHLMPAGLYSYCRARGSDPIKIGGGIVFPTSRQTKDHLLCQECEQVLNKGGESWVISKLATIEKTFPLFDAVCELPLILSESDATVYSGVQNLSFNPQKLEHFGMGLFWKASVHSWTRHSNQPRIDLGPYSNKIRLWLRHEAPFPEHIYLSISISTPERAQIVFNDPYEGVRQDGRTYVTHVPGVLFVISVGKQVSNEIRSLCFHRNISRPIMVSESLTGQIEKLFATQFAKSRKTGAFLRSRAKHQAGRAK